MAMIQRGQPLTFPFPLGALNTTPTCEISRDGAAFVAMAGTVTELTGGWYTVTLTSTDTDAAQALGFRASADGSTFQLVLFLENAYTDARAVKLDHLDAPVSSRYTAATALLDIAGILSAIAGEAETLASVLDLVTNLSGVTITPPTSQDPPTYNFTRQRDSWILLPVVVDTPPIGTYRLALRRMNNFGTLATDAEYTMPVTYADGRFTLAFRAPSKAQVYGWGIECRTEDGHYLPVIGGTLTITEDAVLPRDWGTGG